MILGIAVAVPLIVGFVRLQAAQDLRGQHAPGDRLVGAAVPRARTSTTSSTWSRAGGRRRRRCRPSCASSTATRRRSPTAKALCTKHRRQRRSAGASTRLMPGVDCDDPATIDTRRPLVQGLSQARAGHRLARRQAVDRPANDPRAGGAASPTPSAQVYDARNLERRLSQSEGAADLARRRVRRPVDAAQRRRAARSSTSRSRTTSSPSASRISRTTWRPRRKKLADELNTVEVKLIALRAQRDEYAQLQSHRSAQRRHARRHRQPGDDQAQGDVRRPVHEAGRAPRQIPRQAPGS